jgi:hypothetical protein
MFYRVVQEKFTDVSEVLADLYHEGEDGGGSVRV